ncbi:aliphatic sulfonate ABC transporter substrate-binding protein [Neobacillus sp. LXY-4]|uniref:aliphatic sulfonate ABC transporter substrate-binding protein n=1 Tax=Neobacillus sp. LXY-4 TaxID=3379826 RepID=UPI003EE19E08
MKKIIILSLILFLSISLFAGCSSIGKKQETASVKNEKVTITIGIQQILGPLMLARNKGWFEEEFAKLGVDVKWSEFQSGPPHFEAMASDRLDFGQVGNSPVLAAQAAGIPFKEIASISEGLKGNAIIVQKGSSIKTLKDLKGKKVAVAKGSSGFNLLYQAIDKAGLKPEDVEIIQLQPDEAQPAFETGAVDAWAIWDPFISLQQLKNGARVLANCESVNVVSPSFTIVREKFAKEHPELVVEFLKVYEKALKWQNEHPEEAIKIFAEEKKLAPEVVEQVLENTTSINVPIDKKIINSQQETADFQYSLKAINQKIDTKQVVDNSYIKKALKEFKEETKE